MTHIAVIAHESKTLGGGLDELRSGTRRPWRIGVTWSPVAKSQFVPKAVSKALKERAELIIIWGGDGSVQRAWTPSPVHQCRSPSCPRDRQPVRDESGHTQERAGGT